MGAFQRKRFARRQRRPNFNGLTSNVEFAKALDEGDGRVPERTLRAPNYQGLGAQWLPAKTESRDKAPGPMH